MVTYEDTSFFTNEYNNTLVDRFNILLKNTEFFDCLVGYFYVSGFYKLEKSLENTKKVRILVGMGIDSQTFQLIEDSQQTMISTSEFKKQFNKDIIEEMNNSENRLDVELGSRRFIDWLREGKLEIKAYKERKTHSKLYIMSFPEDDKDNGRVITGSSNFTRPGLEKNLEFNVELRRDSDYFFEKGLNILKENGIFAFICSNKFTKSKYGEKLRKLLLKNQLKIYNDYTGVKIFKEAQVDTSVIQIKKSYTPNNSVFIDMSFYINQSSLNKDAFIFERPEVLDLIDKIHTSGVPLKKLNVNINYGIKTGFDNAFILDEETKNRLISQDNKNKEIIKPLIRGRDVKKGKIFFKNTYIILAKNGVNIPSDYPVIFEYMNNFKDKLINRTDQGNHWTNLRACTYYADFEEDKLVYPNMAPRLFTVLDDEKYITNPKCYILTSDSINLRYLSALLSSNVLNFIFSFIGNPLGNAVYDIHKRFVEKMPIILADEDTQKIIINLINQYFYLNKKYVNEVNDFHNWLINSLRINKLSKKLENYYELTFKDFKKEILKKNSSIGEELLREYFEKNISSIQQLDDEIKSLDSKINNIIYQIYKLTNEEIIIIENKLRINA